MNIAQLKRLIFMAQELIDMKSHVTYNINRLLQEGSYDTVEDAYQKMKLEIKISEDKLKELCRLIIQ